MCEINVTGLTSHNTQCEGRAGSDSRDDLKINKHRELWFGHVKPIPYSMMHDVAGGRTSGGAE